MDETLAHAAVDVSGRPYCVHTGEPDHLQHTTIAGGSVPYHTVVNRHVFETLAANARIALHVRVLYGRDPHHITEAQYKAVARALAPGGRARSPGVGRAVHQRCSVTAFFGGNRWSFWITARAIYGRHNARWSGSAPRSR